MLLPNVPVGDILYLNAKSNGGYDDGVHRNTCYYIQPSFVSPGMKRFFQSPEWNNLVRWDNLLYQAANRSLDLTIDYLGRERFEARLAVFRNAQQVAKERCLDGKDIFPCTSKGKKNMNKVCLWSDSGYVCLG
jgi:endo-1,4-beta-D-glucanase Y